MVVLAASICTKGGKAVVSRQFRDMTKGRIESLLASFPKLIPTGTQHTSVEPPTCATSTNLWRTSNPPHYNKASNILQDIETLHLFARVVSDLCRSAEQREISKHAFELLGAFDEIVSLGYREQVNLAQIRNVLEMESHEEKIQEIIARNKEAEAKEELKRRAKQLEMQRREQQRRTAAGGPSEAATWRRCVRLRPVPQRYDTPVPPLPARVPAASSVRAPAFKGSGMKLGARRYVTPGTPAVSNTPEPVAPPAPRTTAAACPLVHVVIRETITAEMVRDGGLNNLELKGDMNLQISDPDLSKLRIALAPAAVNFGPELQFKQHPKVDKFAANRDRVVALKDPTKGFPVGQPLAVLKWRYAGKDETYVPLSINCWPTPSNDGTCEVNIEYELENEGVTLHDVVISIPLPDGSYPTVSSHTGEWALNPSVHALDWNIPVINADDRSGSMEFSVGGDDPGAFFPVKVAFIGEGSIAGVHLASVTKVGSEEDVVYSEDATLQIENYTVV
ncbi:Mu homology domain-containing protein [Fomitopsis serialis]|uniref:Mu homology domain-containing protein n=1 Tax=Fomitopsis serialis TaxID=139415 RepID=UPI0020075F15|nr:Mu homology domain-containing protein [Neoantrodia serialis]KAH9929799.1 Mu homology domain-containing protein [Neoantrodia serialis]